VENKRMKKKEGKIKAKKKEDIMGQKIGSIRNLSIPTKRE